MIDDVSRYDKCNSEQTGAVKDALAVQSRKASATTATASFIGHPMIPITRNRWLSNDL